MHEIPFSKSSKEPFRCTSILSIYCYNLLRQSAIITFTSTFRHFHWEPFNAKNLHKIHVKIIIFFEPQDNLNIGIY